MQTTALSIETRGLRRVFKSRTGDVEAVAGVDLEVRTGEVFGFLGPNGAGKTTTLRMLSTLLPPTAGTALVCGHDLLHEQAAVRTSIGYVGQRGGTDPEVRGRDELVFQGRLYGMSKSEAVRRADELLRLMELEAAADRKAGTYSGGQRRRLDIALGLMHRPQLLFLDEPTTGLDRALRDVLTLLVQSILLIVCSLPFGLRLTLSGALITLALVALIGILMASVSYAVALWLRDENSFAPLIFTSTLPLLLLSGVLLPLSLAPGWLRDIADVDPLRYAVDAARDLFNDHIANSTVAGGVGLMAVLAAIAVTIAARQFGRAIA
ncbi:MAG TPA: ATP-binding cassette domain-containing protein [Vicinamibacterales bacterium]|nr:ATP-binding cassette domain-containing protein [Vicinamibacterales bacterium]